MDTKPEVVADNEPVGPEPDGFWRPVHDQVDEWVKRYANDSD